MRQDVGAIELEPGRGNGGGAQPLLGTIDQDAGGNVRATQLDQGAGNHNAAREMPDLVAAIAGGLAAIGAPDILAATVQLGEFGNGEVRTARGSGLRKVAEIALQALLARLDVDGDELGHLGSVRFRIFTGQARGVISPCWCRRC